MPKAALLRVNDQGVILMANSEAEEWLGSAEGARCCDLVAARTAAGRSVCSDACAAALHRTGGSTGGDAATVGDRSATLTCSALGDEIVVALLASVKAPVEMPLSEREREVLALVAQGFTNRRVSQRLSIGMSTVRTHMERILDKLGVRSRASAVQRAMATGQLPSL